MNHVETYRRNIESVKSWKSQKKVKMTSPNIKKCAAALGLTSAAVRDILNQIETDKRKEVCNER